MAGYVRKPKTYVLEFEDEDMAGLVVKAKGCSVGRLAEMDAITNVEELGRARIALLAEAISEWNLETETGDAVPISFESIMDQDAQFVVSIFLAWNEAVTSVSAPKSRSSNSGEHSLVASVPMEAL